MIECLPVLRAEGVRNHSTLRIGGIEFTKDGTGGLVLGDGKCGCGIEIGGWIIRYLPSQNGVSTFRHKPGIVKIPTRIQQRWILFSFLGSFYQLPTIRELDCC